MMNVFLSIFIFHVLALIFFLKRFYIYEHKQKLAVLSSRENLSTIGLRESYLPC